MLEHNTMFLLIFKVKTNDTEAFVVVCNQLKETFLLKLWTLQIDKVIDGSVKLLYWFLNGIPTVLNLMYVNKWKFRVLILRLQVEWSNHSNSKLHLLFTFTLHCYKSESHDSYAFYHLVWIIFMFENNMLLFIF